MLTEAVVESALPSGAGSVEPYASTSAVSSTASRQERTVWVLLSAAALALPTAERSRSAEPHSRPVLARGRESVWRTPSPWDPASTVSRVFARRAAELSSATQPRERKVGGVVATHAVDASSWGC